MLAWECWWSDGSLVCPGVLSEAALECSCVFEWREERTNDEQMRWKCWPVSVAVDSVGGSITVHSYHRGRTPTPAPPCHPWRLLVPVLRLWHLCQHASVFLSFQHVVRLSGRFVTHWEWRCSAQVVHTISKRLIGYLQVRMPCAAGLAESSPLSVTLQV